MRRRFITILKGYIGVLLIIIALISIFYWEKYGRQKFLSAECIVFRQDIEKNTVITKEMLQVIRCDKELLIKNIVDESEEIIGREAKHFIPKNTQLDKRYFEEQELVLDEGEFIFKVPKEWIKTLPNTLRRKDVVYFYPVANIEANQSDIGRHKRFKEDEAVCNTTVAYVKDSSNKEVITLEEKQINKDVRLDSTSTVSSLEIIADIDRINLLKEYYDNSYSFIIMYN